MAKKNISYELDDLMCYNINENILISKIFHYTTIYCLFFQLTLISFQFYFIFLQSRCIKNRFRNVYSTNKMSTLERVHSRPLGGSDTDSMRYLFSYHFLFVCILNGLFVEFSIKFLSVGIF